MKVCLAAIDSSKHMGEQLYTVPFMLTSFYYVDTWMIPVIKNAQFFLLDSGAFTFMSSNGGKTDFDAYLEKYARFINDNGIDYFFELDIDSVVGYDKVKVLRKRLESTTGKRCIPVWHVSRGLKEFVALCEEYDYIAIGGIVSREIRQKDYPKLSRLVAIAHRCNCKIHGLGFTNLKYLPIIHFDSVDSSSWTSGRRFGTIYQFNGKTLVMHKKENARVSHYPDADRHNLQEWVKFQRYADTYL